MIDPPYDYLEDLLRKNLFIVIFEQFFVNIFQALRRVNLFWLEN
jgi:hypothetical protein